MTHVKLFLHVYLVLLHCKRCPGHGIAVWDWKLIRIIYIDQFNYNPLGDIDIAVIDGQPEELCHYVLAQPTPRVDIHCDEHEGGGYYYNYETSLWIKG